MATKTEQRMREMLREYLQLQQDTMYSNILTNANSIFAVGFLIGIVFTYSSITPLVIGFIAGFTIAKKDIPLVNYFAMKITSFITNVSSAPPAIDQKLDT